MKPLPKLKVVYFFYCLLVLLVFGILGKFVVDFGIMARTTAVKKSKEEPSREKFVLKPRYQVQTDRYNYIQAEKGYLVGDDYVFEKVKMTGDFGDITSGKLDIRDDKNTFVFTENPEFVIYVEE